MVTKGLNKITQNETQALQLVDNFCKSWVFEEVAGAERLELSTVGFGDRCSTIRTMPLWNCRSIINKLPLFVKGHIKINLIFF